MTWAAQCGTVGRTEAKEIELRRIILFGVLLGAVGLVVGYLIFARGMGGEYVSISTLFQTPESVVGNLVDEATGVAEMRQNILIAGAVGLGLGVVAALVRR